MKEETAVVNADGTLANVFVYLADAPPSTGSDREPALLDQVDCRYVPHAVGVQVDQPLRVRSSDEKTLHNVHYDPQRNSAANFGLTAAGAEKTIVFDQPEFIRVKCDVHPWMTSYVGVFESPFFAVTGEKIGEKPGSYEIPKVPAGSYKLIAWHEQLGTVEKQIIVRENEPVEVSFEFKAP